MNERSPPILSLHKTLFATCVGNALEWFDIAVYAFFARYIAIEFFPTQDTSVSMLLTFGSFGISFLIRPLGAIILGGYADRYGRKKALLLSITLMTVGCAMIVLMPGYASIGLSAPILILLARLIQGFSAGGEFGSSTAFLVEHFPQRKAFIASWQFATQGASTLLASAFGLGLTQCLSEADIQRWGWRLPFIFGLLIGPIGLYIRRNIHEPVNFDLKRTTYSPLKNLIFSQHKQLSLSIGLMVISTGINYMLNYIPAFATENLHLDSKSAFAATLIGGIILTTVTPIVGLMAERIGRRPLMWSSLILLIFTIYPAFRIVVYYPTSTLLVILVCWLALLKSIYFATLPSMMADLFPTDTRSSGMAISYNIAVTIFGGFAPLICSVLINITGTSLAPGYYLMVLVIISSYALLRAKSYQVS